jgi:hypothetical protein
MLTMMLPATTRRLPFLDDVSSNDRKMADAHNGLSSNNKRLLFMTMLPVTTRRFLLMVMFPVTTGIWLLFTMMFPAMTRRLLLTMTRFLKGKATPEQGNTTPFFQVVPSPDGTTFQPSRACTI